MTEDPNSKDAFTIYYNNSPVTILKHKFSLYSEKFRTLPEFVNSNSIKVTGNAPLPVFTDFIKGAQGMPIQITDANIYDLLAFCEEWRTPTFNQMILDRISSKPNFSEIIEHTKRMQTEFHDTPGLEEILAINLNAVLEMPSFQSLPLQTLCRIVNHPKAIADMHLLVKFVLEMLNKIGTDASVLAPAIDIRKLTNDEAKQFLNAPDLMPSCINDSLLPMSLQLFQENNEFKTKLEQTNKTLELVLQRLNRLETNPGIVQQNQVNLPMPTNSTTQTAQTNVDNSEFATKIESLNNFIAVANNKIENLQNQFLDFQKQFQDQLAEIDKKAHKDVRKTNKIVNGLTRKSVAYDKSFIEMKNEQVNIRNRMTDISKQVSTVQNELIIMKTKPKVMKTIDLEFAGRSFNGIMKYLSDEAHQNCHLAGLVDITASTCDHNEPYQIVDMGWNDLFFTENKANQWIMIDFKNKMVKVTHYTIKTHKYPNNFPHLKIWVLEGSNGNDVWEEIDKRAITVLNGSNRFQTFPCKKKDGEFRYIRLKQTGTNAKGDFVLALTNFELFGDLLIPDESN